MNKIALGLLATLISLLVAAAPVQAASCNGASHQLALSNGTTTPGSVTLGAPMTFTVTYTDTADCAPTAITLSITGVGGGGGGGGGTTTSADSGSTEVRLTVFSPRPEPLVAAYA